MCETKNLVQSVRIVFCGYDIADRSVSTQAKVKLTTPRGGNLFRFPLDNSCSFQCKNKRHLLTLGLFMERSGRAATFGEDPLFL